MDIKSNKNYNNFQRFEIARRIINGIKKTQNYVTKY